MNVFRAAHSIKGAARTVNLKDIEMIAHRMENALVKIREGGLSLTPPLFDVLLSAVDAIGNIMAAHLRGEKIASDVIAAVLARLDETAAPTSEPTLSLDSNSSLVRPQAYTPPDPVDPNGEKSSPPNGIPS
jgi:two-component system chemotaxis sensor kinase CheA